MNLLFDAPWCLTGLKLNLPINIPFPKRFLFNKAFSKWALEIWQSKQLRPEHELKKLEAVLWNRNYFLRFRFRFRFLLLKSFGSGSGSDFWKSYGSGSYFWKITVPVPVPAPYLAHKKLIFQEYFWKFFCLFT